MKKLLFLTLSTLLALPAIGGTTTTKTSSQVHDTRGAAPVMGTDLEMNSELSRDDEMIEAQEEDYFDDMERNQDQERMEDNYYSESDEVEDMIDYRDRTRTNRERKAINTGSDASDDQ